MRNLILKEDIREIFDSAPEVVIPADKKELLALSLGGEGNSIFEVEYKTTDGIVYKEATVVRCNNGLAVNYPDAYVRRRDPNCLVIGDDDETDKPRFEDRFGYSFKDLRKSTFEWLKQQELIVMPFYTGGRYCKYPSLFVGPKNAAFFAAILAEIQSFIPPDEVPEDFRPVIYLFLAPIFRHTHFDGKQVVVHNRKENSDYEIFSYNLYPGPSAKKGLYGALLHIGEREKWLTLHAASVKVQTPYENIIILLHEGASGGGKSEMNEEIERLEDGRILVGENILTGDKHIIHINETCKIFPITDDMTLCHYSFQRRAGKITVADAENAWFIRVDHIKHYGTNPTLERISIHTKEPILFLNIKAVPNSTCLIWEHIEDEPGRPCPNPRIVLPKRLIPNVVDEPVEVDYRSFGIRTPPTYKGNIGYGIFGLFHILPPALAWIYRLVSPRGYDNPSVVKTGALESEGVGSYGPFLTGSAVNHANLLLEQIVQNPGTIYVVFPNQYIGCWKVGFMPQWISREYLARRGARKFTPEEVVPSEIPILGYTKKFLKIEESVLPEFLLRPETQPEMDEETFLEGGRLLYDFFVKQAKSYYKPNLSSLGKRIIECLLDNGSIQDYEELI